MLVENQWKLLAIVINMDELLHIPHFEIFASKPPFLVTDPAALAISSRHGGGRKRHGTARLDANVIQELSD